MPQYVRFYGISYKIGKWLKGPYENWSGILPLTLFLDEESDNKNGPGEISWSPRFQLKRSLLKRTLNKEKSHILL